MWYMFNLFSSKNYAKCALRDRMGLSPIQHQNHHHHHRNQNNKTKHFYCTRVSIISTHNSTTSFPCFCIHLALCVNYPKSSSILRACQTNNQTASIYGICIGFNICNVIVIAQYASEVIFTHIQGQLFIFTNFCWFIILVLCVTWKREEYTWTVSDDIHWRCVVWCGDEFLAFFFGGVKLRRAKCYIMICRQRATYDSTFIIQIYTI